MLKLISGLFRTRQQFTSKLSQLFLTNKKFDVKTLNELENILIRADVGVKTTKNIITYLTKQKITPNKAENFIQEYLIKQLKPYMQLLEITARPFMMLIVGVNGSGKTTTIAKIAKYFKNCGKKVMLVAGDTFRAAAIEQLTTWGDILNIPVIKQHKGADSAAVIFDALQSAKSKNIDILLADTAGRLHTNNNLMEELKKVKRVIQKLDINAPHEVMLIIDASIGQNSLQQAIKFHASLGITSITITKLDGTAKGGIIFAVTNKLKLPIRYLGVGEDINDLVIFKAQSFVENLFGKKDLFIKNE